MGTGQASQEDWITDLSINIEHTEWTKAISRTYGFAKLEDAEENVLSWLLNTVIDIRIYRLG